MTSTWTAGVQTCVSIACLQALECATSLTKTQLHRIFYRTSVQADSQSGWVFERSRAQIHSVTCNSFLFYVPLRPGFYVSRHITVRYFIYLRSSSIMDHNVPLRLAAQVRYPLGYRILYTYLPIAEAKPQYK